MRVLFDQAVYDMRNKGNLALLQVAVSRIQEMWPDASLEVLTLSPHLLKLYCPDAKPIRPDGRDDSSKNQRRHELLHVMIPRIIWRLLFELREAVWRRKLLLSRQARPDSMIKNLEIKIQTKNEIEEAKPDNYNKLVTGADLFIATGAQYMSDACKDDALQVLGRLEAAHKIGVTTVMVGQGFGPMKDSDLLAKSRQVLPLVDLIFVRENLVSPQLLTSLGVELSRIFLTGDDAIELAYKSRKETFGRDIGIGLRMAQYTEVNSHHIEILRSIFRKVIDRYKTQLVTLPISHSAHEMDDKVLQQLLTGINHVSKDWRRFNSPHEIIKKVGGCRLVVAGTFHTIVFALAQGIPAICLAKSDMYQEKFSGLVDLFGPGCQIIRLDGNNLEQQLLDAIDLAWNSAEQFRPSLLEAANKQIKLGKNAYQRIFDLVLSRRSDIPMNVFSIRENIEPK